MPSMKLIKNAILIKKEKSYVPWTGCSNSVKERKFVFVIIEMMHSCCVDRCKQGLGWAVVNGTFLSNSNTSSATVENCFKNQKATNLFFDYASDKIIDFYCYMIIPLFANLW